MDARSICSALAASAVAPMRDCFSLPRSSRSQTLTVLCLSVLTAAALPLGAVQAQMVYIPGQMPVVRQQVVQQYVAHGENFLVFAASPQFAEQVLQAAEQYRRDLAQHWLGKELPRWSERCPIHVSASANMGASGRTEFGPTALGVGNWKMVVNGTRERILDSVLPHEISHTILASHFARYTHMDRFVPRWADEGACTTVEHESEKRKHRYYLHQFLKTGKGLAFNKMFRLKEYPDPILPLYAQGHSAVQFLIDQSSPREFVRFLETGMETQDWQTALRRHYQYETIGQFQYQWNKWLLEGSPADLLAYAPKLQSERPNAPVRLASESFRDRQLEGKVKFAIGNTNPTPAQLASSNGVTADSLRTNPQSSGSNPEGSWYKSRLREFSGTRNSSSESPATPDQRIGTPATVAQVTPPSQLQSSASQLREITLPPTGGKNIRSPDAVALTPLPSANSTSVPEPQGNESLAASRNPNVAPAGQTRGSARLQPIQTPKVQVLQWGPMGRIYR